MATTVIFGDTAGGQATSENASYATARSGGTLTTNTAATSAMYGQIYITPSGPYYCQEGFNSFDTSSVPGLRVISATVALAFSTNNSTTNTAFTMNARAYDWGSTLTTADYVAGGSLANNALRASLASSAVTSADTYYSFTSESTFIDNTANPVRLIFCSSRQEGNNTPTGGERLAAYQPSNSGTTYDPKLTVVTSDDPITVNLPPRIAPERMV